MTTTHTRTPAHPHTRTPPYAALLALALALPAHAVVSRIHSLAKIISMADWIAVGKVSRIDAGSRTISATLQPLKGRVKTGTVSGSAPGEPGSKLLARLQGGQRMVLFGGGASGGVVIGFTEGTWFEARRGEEGWTLTKLHPEMARTWTGKSDRLAQLVRDVLAGKTTPPPPNPKNPPSLGPVLHK